jgi:hypothetical protein
VTQFWQDIPALFAEHGTYAKVAAALCVSVETLARYVDANPDMVKAVDAARAEWARRADIR